MARVTGDASALRPGNAWPGRGGTERVLTIATGPRAGRRPVHPPACELLPGPASPPSRLRRAGQRRGQGRVALTRLVATAARLQDSCTLMSAVSFLRNVPALAELADELLDVVAGQVTEEHVAAGDWILREGEEADRVFIVRSGRIEVVSEGPPETLIRVLRRGDVLGELALLRSGPRSASARARRDTALLVLTRAAFESLIRDAPDFALGLVRTIGAQLAASRSPLFHVTPARTIAIVGLDEGAPRHEVADQLGRALGRFGSLAMLEQGSLDSLDRAADDADRVILMAGAGPGDGWTDVCLREADLILAVTSGHPTAVWLQRSAAFSGCELLVAGHRLADGALEVLMPRETHIVADPFRRNNALQALARRLAQRSLGIVLSGGGARAFAHLGVLEELRAAGLQLDRISGVSLGSLIAAATAAEFEPDYIREAFERHFVLSSPTRDFAPPIFSIIRGAKVRRLLGEEFGDLLIEGLPRRFFCVSCDLAAREAFVHRTGRVADAVYSSLAIPGVFPPVVTSEGRLLVDGGVLNNLPVERMARLGEGPVIAVDVGGRSESPARELRPHLERGLRRVRRALTGSEAHVPRLGETIVRTMMVGSSDTTAAARLHADLVITPDVNGIALMDWGAIEVSIERGRVAARAALAKAPNLRTLGAI